jgi:predicted small lipoprotein YifL
LRIILYPQTINFLPMKKTIFALTLLFGLTSCGGGGGLYNKPQVRQEDVHRHDEGTRYAENEANEVQDYVLECGGIIINSLTERGEGLNKYLIIKGYTDADFEVATVAYYWVKHVLKVDLLSTTQNETRDYHRRQYSQPTHYSQRKKEYSNSRGNNRNYNQERRRGDSFLFKVKIGELENQNHDIELYNVKNECVIGVLSMPLREER